MAIKKLSNQRTTFLQEEHLLGTLGDQAPGHLWPLAGGRPGRRKASEDPNAKRRPTGRFILTAGVCQGSLHYTPEHCLVNGGFPLFWC